MKRLLLTFLVASAQAAPTTPAQTLEPHVATMVGNCQGPMAGGVCSVENTDKAQCVGAADPLTCRKARFVERNPNGKLLAGIGRFTADEVFTFVDAGDSMCQKIVEVCKPDASAWGSRECRLARGLWQAYSSNPPGQGIGGQGAPK